MRPPAPKSSLSALTPQLLLEYVSEGVIALDEGMSIREINGRAGLLLRRRPEDVVGRRIADIFPEMGATGTLAELERIRTGRLPRRMEIFLPSLFAWYAVLAVPSDGGLVLFARDISERVRQEGHDAARAAVRKVIESMPLCVTITRGPQHRIEQANRLARALVDNREVEGELVERILPEAREQGFIALLDGVYKSGQAYHGDEIPLRWKPDGTHERTSWFDLVYQPLFDEAGVVNGILHLGTEVTEKVQRRQLIERYAAERQAVLEQLEEGVILTEPSGRITFVNAAAERMHGVALLGVSPAEYSDAYQLLTDGGDPYPSVELPLARAVRARVTVRDAVWRIRRRDGSVLRVRGTAKPIMDPQGELVACVLTLSPWPLDGAA